MFIAILDFSTSAADRPAALAQLDAARPAVVEMTGCVSFRVYASRLAPTDVTVVHEWEDGDAFDRYLGSDAFARSGAVLRPLMTAAPVSRRFTAELLEIVV